MGRNGIQRSEKVARRAERKKRKHRMAAGAAALATVAAVGAGQAMEPAAAEALTYKEVKDVAEKIKGGLDVDNPLGALISDIGNSELVHKLNDQWRLQTCVSGGGYEGADCAGSSAEYGGLGIAVAVSYTHLTLPTNREV